MTQYYCMISKNMRFHSIGDFLVCLFIFFNLPDVDWMNGVAPDDGVQIKLFNYFVTIETTQHISQTTRNDTILDLLFSNDPMIVSDLALMYLSVRVIIIHYISC